MKRCLSFLLVLVMTLGLAPAASAFDDINDFSEKTAAESLASIGVVDSVEQFNPNDSLTRAQFCKIAVLAAGFDEMSLYSGYTIYPDVAAGSWYAPYVNAAVRKYGIIKGDEKGNFNPNSSITYGEAATIMLRMLGYTVEDIGMMWPMDYVNKAENIGLDQGMDKHGANEALKRGQAAILLCNMLLSDNKEGALFASTGLSTGAPGAILLSTSQTNPNLSANQAVLYLDGESVTYSCSSSLNASLCGLKGVPVFDGKSRSRLKGFIADAGGADAVTVRDISSTSITIQGGTINVPRDTLTMAGGTIGKYITCWFDIKEGGQVNLYYNDSGELEFISTRTQASVSSKATAVVGEDSISYKANASFVKNGVEIAKSDLRDYDVVSYSEGNNTYYVSSDKVTLVYQSGSPVYTNPSQITAGNRVFQVSEAAGRYFSQSGVKLGSKITLLLDYNGNLAAVMPTGKVSSGAVGVVSKISESSCEIELLCGLKLEGAPEVKGLGSVSNGRGEIVSSIYKLDGQLVEVSQTTDGLFRLTAVAMTPMSGELDLTKNTLGQKALAPNAVVYECSDKGMSLHKISLDDIPCDKVASSKIIHAETNPQGQVSLLILKDVTGDRFIYGMISMTSEKEEAYSLDGSKRYRTTYIYNIRTSSGTQQYKTPYASDMKSSTGYIPAAISSDLVGEDARSYNFSTPAFALTKAATVSRDDYDAYQGFKIKGGYAKVDEDVVIYCTTSKTFVSTLAEARANFTEFSLYLDRPLSEGGTVRVITIK